jgi:hypothetical protein
VVVCSSILEGIFPRKSLCLFYSLTSGIPKFEGKISFAIWQIQIKVVLTELVVQNVL